MDQFPPSEADIAALQVRLEAGTSSKNVQSTVKEGIRTFIETAVLNPEIPGNADERVQLAQSETHRAITERTRPQNEAGLLLVHQEYLAVTALAKGIIDPPEPRN